MSELHIRQIKAAIEKLFPGRIDLSDVSGKPEPLPTNALLTRGLAAYVLMYLAGISEDDAANAVTDGYEDNGIDAVYYHAAERVLYLVQTKWRHDGRGSFDRAEMGKFLKGFKDLVNARWDRFNPRLRAKQVELESALNDAATRIVLVLATTGQDPLAPEIAQDLKDVLDEINNPVELVSAQVLRQANVYAAVAQGAEGAPIDVELALYDWGQVREPYLAYYGQVSASDVASWYAAHQSRLFAPNIRMFLGATEVNASIMETLLNHPQDFWYFNNGITALCTTIGKKPLGGATRETGIFECRDLRVVNGAQTVGAIADAEARDPESVSKARVTIRIIALEECPPGFDKQVTRSTNTQNRIDRRDFVALDVEQERIRGELQLDGVLYVYKSGEALGSTATGFDLVEATVARACRQADVAFAVQAKREIGKLWEDIDKPPYKILFNRSVAGPALWRLVQIVRVVDDALTTQRAGADGRSRLLSIHGNRFITHLVFSCLDATFVEGIHSLTSEESERVKDLTDAVFPEVLRLVDQEYPDAYLASLFKNAAKGQHLKTLFRCP